MKKKRFLLLVLILALFITIGFATLRTNLQINGTANFKGNNWDIHFENVVVSSDSVTADEPTLANGATKLSFSVNLQKPGDKYEFTVDVVNAGSIDAMINTINKTTLSGDDAKYAELSFTYVDGREIKVKDLLEYSSSETIKVIVGFKKDLSASDLPSGDNEIDVELEIEYVQADETAVAVAHKPSGPVSYYAFGEPTTDSTTDYTTLNKNLFVKLEGEQKSVCIIRNSELVCFKNNNVEEEQNHVKEVFGESSCGPYSSGVDCSVGAFGCSVNSNGRVTCGDSSTGAYCSVYSDGRVSCIE